MNGIPLPQRLTCSCPPRPHLYTRSALSYYDYVMNTETTRASHTLIIPCNFFQSVPALSRARDFQVQGQLCAREALSRARTCI